MYASIDDGSPVKSWRLQVDPTYDPASHPKMIELLQGHPPIKAFLGVPLIQSNMVIGMAKEIPLDLDLS